MTAALAEACTGLAAWYPVVAALIAEPDTGPATHGGKPGSRPPWNPAAANAALDAHALAAADLPAATTGAQGAGGNGNKPYAPLHGPGNDPYMLTEIATGLDRRTAFTGEVNPE